MSIQSGAIYPEELDAMTRLLERVAGQLGIAKASPELEELGTRLVTLMKLPINEDEVIRLLVAGYKRKAVK